MSLELCYETEETLDLPYEEIAEKVIAGCLAAEHCPFAAEVSLSFVDDAAIRSLNREFRNIDRETDVLSNSKHPACFRRSAKRTKIRTPAKCRSAIS